MDLKIFGEAEERTIDQIKRCAEVEDDAKAVLCADSHVGYSMPIGGVVAYREHVSPVGVGFDIGCGNKAVRTNLRADDVEVSGVMDQIVRKVSFGMGRNNPKPVDHPVLDRIREAPFEPQRQMYDLAARQLGTVGAGNHYIDLFSDQDGLLWVGVHFGSRGFGHKTCMGFLSLAQGGSFTAKGSEGGMDSPPVVFRTDTDLGQGYIEAMKLAGEYAYAGRDVVVDIVLGILGAEATDEVHNHHNFAWLEEHDGERRWVIRKGATPALAGQRGFVGSTMGEDSVILEGTDDAQRALFSTVHDAGRVMSRREAAGNLKWRTRWHCSVRDCDYSHADGAKFRCPHHPDSKPVKYRETKVVRPGKINFSAVRDDLQRRGIELRGGAADEAPDAYKRLDRVLAAHQGTIRILHRLKPLGVAMAGPETFDPYRD